MLIVLKLFMVFINLKDGFREVRDCMLVLGCMCLFWVRMVMLLMFLIGMIDLLNLLFV